MENMALIATIVIVAVFFVLRAWEKKSGEMLQDELTSALMKGEFDRFDELINSRKTRRLIPFFNIDFMKLNAAMMRNDAKTTEELLQRFEKLRLNRTQKEAVGMKAFYYYLSLSDKDKARHWYQALKEGRDNQPWLQLDRIADTYVEGGYRYLDEALQQIRDNEDPMVLAMIADMYANMGDEENHQRYAQRAQKKMEEAMGSSESESPSQPTDKPSEN